MMNIQKLFRSKGVVDWLDLELRYLTATPAWRIFERGAGAFSCVTGLDPDTGKDISETGAQRENTPTTRFRVRIQNPERFASIIDAISHGGIGDRLDQSAEILVTAIEVSFDLYALPGTDDSVLAEMAALLATSVNHVSSARPRLYRHTGETHFATLHRDLLVALKDGYMVGFGDRDDDLYQRAYFKKTDDNEILTKPEHRARIEIRLQGKACPVRTLADLMEFDFARLAKFFKFRQPDPHVSGIMALVINRRVSKGGVLDERGQLSEAFRKRGRKRRTSPNTIASPLSEIARDQLRKLTARWRASAGRGKIKKSPNICASHCENSGGLPPLAISLKRRRTNHRQSSETQAVIGLAAHAKSSPKSSWQVRPNRAF